VSHSRSVPREFEIPSRATERHLAVLRDAVSNDAPASLWARPRRRTLLVTAACFLLAAAAIATAATVGLFDRDITRADLDARLTTITRTTRECTAPGGCAPERTVTVGVIEVRPSDGITLVDPTGRLIEVTPAAGTIGFESASSYGLELSRSRQEHNRTEQAKIELPDGGTRLFSWRMGDGHITATDLHPDGTTSRIILRSGDVVPLLPGSLHDRTLTPDKAVTFDLAHGHYPLWIYPQRNEAYVGRLPWRPVGSHAASLPVDVAQRYGLSRSGDHYDVPIGPAGGSWSYTVDHGRIRTVTWKAGETTVTVSDRDGNGKVLGTETISIGRQVYAG
jgi:hypothetical protein